MLPSLVLTVESGLLASLVGVTWAHGSWHGVFTITVFCLYVASLTVLSVYKEAVAIAATLAPALAFSLLYLLDPNRYVRALEVGSVAVTVVASLVLALRHARLPWWSPLELGAHERRAVSTYFVYGGCCGVAVSAITLVAHGAASFGPVALVALPVMLSLGVLEWQLHTFRARASKALRTSSTLAAFERRAVGDLLRCTACYVTALVLVSIVIVLVRGAGGHQYPFWPWGPKTPSG